MLEKARNLFRRAANWSESNNEWWEATDPYLKIKACVGDNSIEMIEDIPHFNISKAEYVDWKENPVNFSKNPYADKYSKEYGPCTGWLITAMSKKGEPISLLVHQYSWDYSHTDNEKYAQKVRSEIHKFLFIAQTNTVDAVQFAGQVGRWGKEGDEMYAKNIKSTSEIIAKVLGFTPHVISGPAIATSARDPQATDVATNFYQDKKTKKWQPRLWITRIQAQHGLANQPYLASDVDEQLKRIKKEYGLQ